MDSTPIPPESRIIAEVGGDLGQFSQEDRFSATSCNPAASSEDEAGANPKWSLLTVSQGKSRRGQRRATPSPVSTAFSPRRNAGKSLPSPSPTYMLRGLPEQGSRLRPFPPTELDLRGHKCALAMSAENKHKSASRWQIATPAIKIAGLIWLRRGSGSPSRRTSSRVLPLARKFLNDLSLQA
jgi:hypothetical protein